MSAILQPMHPTCESAFMYFFALKAILPSIGYNLKIRPILQSAISFIDQDSSEESPDFTNVTS